MAEENGLIARRRHRSEDAELAIDDEPVHRPARYFPVDPDACTCHPKNAKRCFWITFYLVAFVGVLSWTILAVILLTHMGTVGETVVNVHDASAKLNSRVEPFFERFNATMVVATEMMSDPETSARIADNFRQLYDAVAGLNVAEFTEVMDHFFVTIKHTDEIFERLTRHIHESGEFKLMASMPLSPPKPGQLPDTGG